MHDSEHLASRIVDLLESYYFENACMRLVLKQFVPGWPHKLHKRMADDRTAMEILGEIAPIRREVLRSSDSAEQLEALLRFFPKKPGKRLR